ncbi:hypothetical protein N7456_010925 [Penicillium angulare]|uniref:Translationally-controlled tumor protein homolog n=1 Tax=Penicillium angulare TaxID=116970 RepID=A0A9W9ET01_9EURO|nr:hypothetical protein N7456_010925 [Penicillium angulare]
MTTIYKDIVTGDEMFSDAFNIQDINDVVFEVDCALVDAAVALLPPPAYSIRQENLFGSLRNYIHAVEAKLQERGDAPEEIANFHKGLAAYVEQQIVTHIKDFEFYIGASLNSDGMVALLNYREDGVTPYFTFWKHGLEEMQG